MKIAYIALFLCKDTPLGPVLAPNGTNNKTIGYAFHTAEEAIDDINLRPNTQLDLHPAGVMVCNIDNLQETKR